MPHTISRLLRKLPHAGHCVLCAAPAHRRLDLCAPCERDLPWLKSACLYCGLPLPAGDSLCAACLKQRPVFSAAICAFEYRFPVDILINRFKDQRHLASGRVLIELATGSMAGELRRLKGDDCIVAPVPLHKTKLRTRGYNQAAIIAGGFASALSLGVEPNLVRRTRRAPDQKTLNVRERRANLKGAFLAAEPVRGKRVLLIDDVITTASTVTEIAGLLFARGASDVVVLALARTPL